MEKNKLFSYITRPDLRTLSINFINFGVFQLIGYIAPLVTIPYIVRIVGPEKFGIISLAQAVAYYFGILTDYGYNISGIQHISQNQSDINKRSQIVKTVLNIQLIISLISFILLLIVLESFEFFYLYKDVFLYSFLIVPANILLVQWFYIGMEEVKYISYITFLSRMLYIITIFLFIHEKGDYVFVPLLNSCSILIAGFYSFFVLTHKYHTKFSKEIPLKLLSFLKRDRSIYVSTIFMNLYRNSNVLILSLYASESAIGLYSAAEKIIKALQSTLAPITQVFYPFISRLRSESKERGIKIIKKLLMALIFLGALVTSLIFSFSDEITLIALGSKFIDSSIIIKIGSFVLLFGVINYILGIIFMTNFSLKNEFTKSVIFAGIFNLVACFILSNYFFEIGAIIAFSSSEVVLLIAIIYYIFKYDNKWREI